MIPTCVEKLLRGEPNDDPVVVARPLCPEGTKMNRLVASQSNLLQYSTPLITDRYSVFDAGTYSNGLRALLAREGCNATVRFAKKCREVADRRTFLRKTVLFASRLQ